ncbi:hypothetical protein V2S66_16765 [Streptomyces sp. V4-01]|uniref:Uncharacterized protein n=1 Tax=Actinacidiphila polyblastidii TaxID=3110430 RepID=A0ABU7PE97_9ACTN|nr:hypothetical protein [Streptomyces sp. V4-01]
MPVPDPNAPLRHPAPSRYDPSGLRAFSDGLARRLPGSWSAVTEDYFAYSPAHADVMDRLWDTGPVEWALQDFVHDEAALLNGPGGENFVVLARPLHRGQFLVAALAPPGIDGVLRPIHTPHGIAVPGDPVRAAADVERRLLPRYRHAVEAARLPALREAHRLAEQALADWDAVSDSLCDASGMPLDEDAYGIRQAQRDAEAWQPFETFLFHGPGAIDHAKAALPELPLPASTADRWSYQPCSLTAALTEGMAIRDEWESRLTAVLDQRTGPDRWVAFNDTLAERNAEGWHAMTVFMDHAPVLHAIADVERERAEFAAVRVAAARARSTTTVPRSGSRLPTPAPSSPPPGPPARPHTPGR